MAGCLWVPGGWGRGQLKPLAVWNPLPRGEMERKEYVHKMTSGSPECQKELN